MEIDSFSEFIAESETVSVCLKCGNQGFEETLVYCFKCQHYALHRYCLDGSVVFTDDVIWFCEDCEGEVIDVDFSDNAIVDSENTEISFSEDYDQDNADSENVDVEDCDVDNSDNEIADSKKTEDNSSEVDSEYECATVADPDPHPIADPIWSLQLINRSFELMSHLSTLACLKVLEETRHLPDVLYADLLQRSAVWPQSFSKYGTNNQSIGLYFFPENERVERYFDELVYEMISSNLAIRAKVEEAELLIFSSTMLPCQYRSELHYITHMLLLHLRLGHV
ncbi:unnamed protein product [Lathyrus sativus]|nr:unnamed protein product [Lathyrus sativus]